MPTLTKKAKKRASTDTYPVVHIVTPAHRLTEAKRGGDPAVALCGAAVVDDGDPEAGICRDCVLAQFKVDDLTFDERTSQQYQAGFDSGKTVGVKDGRRLHANELRDAAYERARLEREELEKPRFELLEDGLLKFTFEDGVSTVRAGHVGSVALDFVDGQHRVTVEGRVLVANADRDLIRRHFDKLYVAVFGAPDS